METIWVTVTEEDLQRTCMNPLLNAQRTAALASGQADPLTAALEEATAKVRAAIQTCARNSVSSDTTTVPMSLRDVTCWIAFERIAKRLTVIKLTSDQTSAISDAKKEMERVAKCELAVETPSEALSPASVQRGGGASVVCPDSDYRTTTREQRSGLI